LHIEQDLVIASMKFSLPLLVLAASVAAAPVDKRQDYGNYGDYGEWIFQILIF